MREPEILLPEIDGAEIAKLDPAGVVRAPPTTGPPDIHRLMEIALGQGEGGVAALEKLVSLQERMEDREAGRAFARAMLAFQNACPVIHKNAKGHTNKYSSYDYCVSVAKPHAQANGLSWGFRDDTTVADGFIRKIMTIRHTGGHSEEFVGPLFPNTPSSKGMNDQQAVGSAESYAMRYTFLPGFGLASGEDTDAATPDPFLTEDQLANVEATLVEIKPKDGKPFNRARYLKHLGIDQFGHLPQSRYRGVVNALQRKRDE